MKTLLKFSAVLLLCGLVGVPATLRGAPVDAVPNLIRSFYKTNRLVGLSVCIRTPKKTTAYHHGFANLEYRAPVNSLTVFRIASVSKLFTTLGILKLKDQGKLSVEDKLSKYVAEFPYADSITIKNLLQHTSGIPNFAHLEDYDSNQASEWTAVELVEMLRLHLQANSLVFAPGTQAEYSNSNFMLLGVIIEAITGMTFKDYLAQEVIAPLGLAHTGVGSDSEIVRYRAAGYQVANGAVSNAPFVSVVSPFATGDVMSRPMELAKLTRAFQPGRLLGQATITEMGRPTVLNDGSTFSIHSDQMGDFTFGYGWELIKPVGKNDWVYTKSGAISGFFAYLLYFPRADVTVAINSNAQGSFHLLTLGMEIGREMGLIK